MYLSSWFHHGAQPHYSSPKLFHFFSPTPFPPCPYGRTRYFFSLNQGSRSPAPGEGRGGSEGGHHSRCDRYGTSRLCLPFILLRWKIILSKEENSAVSPHPVWGDIQYVFFEIESSFPPNSSYSCSAWYMSPGLVGAKGNIERKNSSLDRISLWS